MTIWLVTRRPLLTFDIFAELYYLACLFLDPLSHQLLGYTWRHQSLYLLHLSHLNIVPNLVWLLIETVSGAEFRLSVLRNLLARCLVSLPLLYNLMHVKELGCGLVQIRIFFLSLIFFLYFLNTLRILLDVFNFLLELLNTGL